MSITGERSEESSGEELIWTYLGEIFLVMKKSGIMIIIGDFVSVSGPVCGFICGKVVEINGGYAFEEVFASCCDKSAAPLGIFGVIVSSSYESIA